MNSTNMHKGIPMDVSYNTLKESVKKIGYLKKLGGKGISKNWRKRFFLLTDQGILYYFKHRTSSTAVGALNLEKYTKIYKDVNKKKNFMLINENDSSQRVFHLVSDTEEEMNEWISSITDFFQSDVNDLQNHLNDLKQKKQDTISRKAGVKAIKKVEEYELDKLQLVLRGGRLSISVRTGSVDIPSLLTITTPSLNDIQSSVLQSSSSQFDQVPLDQIKTSSSSFLRFNSKFNISQPNINNNNNNENINTTTSTTSTTTPISDDDPTTIGFHDDDDDDDDECDD